MQLLVKTAYSARYIATSTEEPTQNLAYIYSIIVKSAAGVFVRAWALLYFAEENYWSVQIQN